MILNSKLLLNAGERSLDNQKMLSYLHICRRELYHSAQGFVATNRATNDSLSTTESLELIRFFSSNYIAMSVIEIGRIDEVVRHNRLSDSTRPLNLVLLIESAAGIESYARVTRRCDMRGHNVLLFFRRRSDYCREPRADNRLNLEFDSLVLAWCHEAPVLQEWYSIFAGRTKVKDFIGWDPASRTLRLLNDFQIYRRRNSLDGKILRVSEIQDLIGTHRNVSYHREIMRNIAESINFTARFATRRIAGKIDLKLQNLTGIIGELIRNETDLGMAMFMTTKRAKFFSFTVPVLRSETTFLIKNAFDSRLSPSMYYKPLGCRTIIYLVVLYATSPVLFALTLRDKRSFKRALFDSYFDVWGIYTLKSLNEKLPNSSTRIVYWSLSFCCFIHISVYMALLCSYITVFDVEKPINSLTELTAQRSYKIVYLKNSGYLNLLHFANHSFDHKIPTEVIAKEDSFPETISEALKHVCDPRKKVVFFTEDTLLNFNAQMPPCGVSEISKSTIINTGLIFRKNDPYTGIFNYQLQRFNDFGIINVLKNRHWGKKVQYRLPYKAVNLRSVWYIHAFLLGGICLSIIIMIFEVAIFRRNVCK
ncbi:hypothetical protein TKK_0013232 [Trichogramma kaykai]